MGHEAMAGAMGNEPIAVVVVLGPLVQVRSREG